MSGLVLPRTQEQAVKASREFGFEILSRTRDGRRIWVAAGDGMRFWASKKVCAAREWLKQKEQRDGDDRNRDPRSP
jgi:hypothetical protein